MGMPCSWKPQWIRIFTFPKRMMSLNPNVVGTHPPWYWHLCTELPNPKPHLKLKWMGAGIEDWFLHTVRPQLSGRLVFPFHTLLGFQLNLSGCLYLCSVLMGLLLDWGFISRAEHLGRGIHGRETALPMMAKPTWGDWNHFGCQSSSLFKKNGLVVPRLRAGTTHWFLNLCPGFYPSACS